MAQARQITASSPLLVLARFRLFLMQFALTQLFQLLDQQMLQHFLLLLNLQQLFEQLLSTAGIATKDVRSANISVYPEYNWTQEAGTKITGYRASQTFDVLVRTASKAGSIIEAVVTAGGDSVQLGGVIPTTLNPSAATEDARAAAVANAKSKASSYAKLLGTSIGKVLSLEEQSSPVYSSPFPTAKAGAADAAAIEIDLGEQDVTVTITVRWALN
jgi:uncharacterized protein